MKYNNRKPIDLTGHVYGRLTVLSFAGNIKGRRHWNCKCSCGNMLVAPTGRLRFGDTKSCGCYKNELLSKRQTKHGCSTNPTKEYRAWCDIRKRIFNPNDKQYKDYGGRGIKLIYESFESFLKDVGYAPSPKHSIDRIEVNRHYEPGNCRWVDYLPQASNKRNTVRLSYNGETKPLVVWCRELNLDPGTVDQRLRKLKWPVERALQP